MRAAPGLLDKGSPVPLYYQLYLRLQTEIQAGLARPGDMLGTEKEIQERFGVSRATVRKALDELGRTGRLVRVTGRGTFVAQPALDAVTPHLLSFTEELHRRGIEPGSLVLEFGRTLPPAAVAEVLGVRPREEVLHIRRLRTGDDIPIVMVDHYLAPSLRLRREDLQQSLYATLESVVGVRLQEAVHRVAAGLARPDEAEILQIPAGSAVLRFERTTLTPDGRPVLSEQGLGRADLYDYSVHLHRQEQS